MIVLADRERGVCGGNLRRGAGHVQRTEGYATGRDQKSKPMILSGVTARRWR